MQAVRAVQGNTRLKVQYMTALGEWLVQQGAAKEAGKEILLEAASLLDPPAAPSQHQSMSALSERTESSAELLSKMFVGDDASQAQTPQGGLAFEVSIEPGQEGSSTAAASVSTSDTQLLVRHNTMLKMMSIM